MNVLIRSAKIVCTQSPHHLLTKDILIENGTIKNILDSIELPKGFKEISKDNLHVSIGWFDSGVCFGEPGYEHRGTIENGLDTAGKSGFTTLALQPNNIPHYDNKASISFLKKLTESHSVSVHPYGNLTVKAEGKAMAELYDMQSEGAIAFYDFQKSIQNPNILKLALQYAKNFDALICNFPQENNIAEKGMVNEGIESVKVGLRSSPSLAEKIQVSRDLFLLEYTGGKLHIPTISTKKSVDLIREAKDKNLDISCSVSAHHICFTDEIITNFDTNSKILPPLRSAIDKEALIRGVQDQTIDFITSDHTPVDIDNKKVEFNFALFGTIGLESAFGAIQTKLSLEKTIHSLTTPVYKRFGLDIPAIKNGAKANLTLFNPDTEYIFEDKDILSDCKNSIFKNQILKGKAYGIYSKNKLLLN